MATVYAWPPVAAIAKSWNLDTPISRSYSMTSGKRFASAARTPRRRVKVLVHGRREYGLGYMAALERALMGGINLVRLTSCRMSFGLIGDMPDGRSGSYFDWRDTSDPATEFIWQTEDGGPSFIWFDGLFIDAAVVSGSGGRTLTVTGNFPRNGIIALPGEFITIFTSANPGGETHMIANLVRASDTPANPRTATIKLVTPASGPGRVDLGVHETGIFELNSAFPDLVRSGDQVPDFQLEFREVFESEIPEGIVELNPWT